jgi:hypothetical protein
MMKVILNCNMSVTAFWRTNKEPMQTSDNADAQAMHGASILGDCVDVADACWSDE